MRRGHRWAKNSSVVLLYTIYIICLSFPTATGNPAVRLSPVLLRVDDINLKLHCEEQVNFSYNSIKVNYKDEILFVMKKCQMKSTLGGWAKSQWGRDAADRMEPRAGRASPVKVWWGSCSSRKSNSAPHTLLSDLLVISKARVGAHQKICSLNTFIQKRKHFFHFCISFEQMSFKKLNSLTSPGVLQYPWQETCCHPL